MSSRGPALTVTGVCACLAAWEWGSLLGKLGCIVLGGKAGSERAAKKTLNVLSAPTVTVCDTKRNPHAPPPRGTSVLPVPLSPCPADGTCPIPGVTAGDCAAGSSRALAQRIVGGCSSSTPVSCLSPCSISVCCITVVLQNKYTNRQEWGGLRRKTVCMCLLARKAEFSLLPVTIQKPFLGFAHSYGPYFQHCVNNECIVAAVHRITGETAHELSGFISVCQVCSAPHVLSWAGSRAVPQDHTPHLRRAGNPHKSRPSPLAPRASPRQERSHRSLACASDTNSTLSCDFWPLCDASCAPSLTSATQPCTHAKPECFQAYRSETKVSTGRKGVTLPAAGTWCNKRPKTSSSFYRK